MVTNTPTAITNLHSHLRTSHFHFFFHFVWSLCLSSLFHFGKQGSCVKWVYCSWKVPANHSWKQKHLLTLWRMWQSSSSARQRAMAGTGAHFSAAMASKGTHHPGQSSEHLPEAGGWRGTAHHHPTEALPSQAAVTPSREPRNPDVAEPRVPSAAQWLGTDRSHGETDRAPTANSAACSHLAEWRIYRCQFSLDQSLEILAQRMLHNIQRLLTPLRHLVIVRTFSNGQANKNHLEF